MGELVNAGVPMLDTLAITADISGNQLYRRMWRRRLRLRQAGQKISQPLQKSPLLRAVVQDDRRRRRVRKLGETLDSVSKFYNKELKVTIKAVTSMIEPLMIVCMGGIVGFIAMSIILPIFKMSQLSQISQLGEWFNSRESGMTGGQGIGFGSFPVSSEPVSRVGRRNVAPRWG